ncbi:LuxR family transcriptional regulator [Salmonella enterica]|nr:LuxR family transcriptional regulator [Salmonella enterica]EKF0974715.1 helix-turn-helix transcriptional regulator [Salmonella enterica]
MIYIISEDIFFNLGMNNILAQNKILAKTTHCNYDIRLFNESDIVIIYTLNLHKVAQILAASLLGNFNIIYAMNKSIKLNTINKCWQNTEKSITLFDCLRFFLQKKTIVCNNKMPGLSRQEERIFDSILKGKRAVQIAQELGIEPKTVSAHKKNALRKYNVSNYHHLSLLTYFYYGKMKLIKKPYLINCAIKFSESSLSNHIILDNKLITLE